MKDMENNFVLTEDLLWDYADGFLSGKEKQQVEAYVQQQPEYSARLDALLAEKAALKSLTLEQPEAGFSGQVMVAWAAEQACQKAGVAAPKRDWILYGIAAALGLCIVVPVLVLILNAGQLPAVSMPVFFPQVNLPPLDLVGRVLASPLLRYGLYLLFAFSLLRLADGYLHRRRLFERLNVQA